MNLALAVPKVSSIKLLSPSNAASSQYPKNTVPRTRYSCQQVAQQHIGVRCMETKREARKGDGIQGVTTVLRGDERTYHVPERLNDPYDNQRGDQGSGKG